MGATGYLWRRETQVRDARLKRIAFGSKIAALRVFQLVASGDTVRPEQAVTLASLRRGRGQARRVVVLCAPEDQLEASLEAACGVAKELVSADFLVVPLLISRGEGSKLKLRAPPLGQLQALATGSTWLASGEAAAAMQRVPSTTETQPALPWDDAKPDTSGAWPIALPQSDGAEWSEALAPELEQATKQDADIIGRGLTIVLKKNGRVGTRRLGLPDWTGLVADVESRKRAGLDVVNI